VFLTPHVVTDSAILSRISQEKLTQFTKKGENYVEDELIVAFKAGVTEEAAKSVIAGQKAAIIETVKEKTYRIKLRKRMITEEAVNTFSALPEVEKIERVPRIKNLNIEEKAAPPPVPSSKKEESSAPQAVEKAEPAQRTKSSNAAHKVAPTPAPSGEKEESSAKENVQSTVAAPVEGQKPEEKTEDVPAVTSPESATAGKYAVQIKAYPETEKNAAMAFVEDVKKKEPEVHMERVSLNRRGIWYRIMVGHFANSEDASSYIKEKKMSDAYPGSFVQTKSEKTGTQ
jgi:type IV secretory pathway VirB10-like protein